MKKIAIIAGLLVASTVNSQIQAPQLSPSSKIEQSVGLTTINIEYSRPSKRDRVIFTDVIPYNEIWRTGANKNTIITTNDGLIFGKDTLQAGTYSIFTKPEKTQWTIYFYKTTDNWGTPEKWEESNVVVKTTAAVTNTSASTETFTISIDDITISGANMSFAWDKVLVKVPFKVLTDSKVEASIKKTMAGPTASDYYRAADYYLTAGKDMKQALEWINKSIELSSPAPFYFLRKKALIQAELKDFKGAIETAKLSLEGAKAAGNNDYVRMNETSIAEWSKK